MPEVRTYRIPDANLESLRAKLDRLGKRAVKLGFAAPVLTVLSVEDVEYWQVETLGEFGNLIHGKVRDEKRAKVG